MPGIGPGADMMRQGMLESKNGVSFGVDHKRDRDRWFADTDHSRVHYS